MRWLLVVAFTESEILKFITPHSKPKRHKLRRVHEATQIQNTTTLFVTQRNVSLYTVDVQLVSSCLYYHCLGCVSVGDLW